MNETVLESEFDLNAPEAQNGRPPAAPPPPARPDLGRQYSVLLQEFQTAIDARLRAEQELLEQFGAPEDETERQLKRALVELGTGGAAELSALVEQSERALGEAEAEFAVVDDGARGEHLARTREIEAQFGRELAELEQKYHDSSWVATSVLDDSAEDSPTRVFERFRQLRERTREQQAAEWTELESTWTALAQERRWRSAPPPPPEGQPRSCDETQTLFAQHADAARQCAAQVRDLKLPRLFLGYRPLVLFLLLFAAAFVPILLLVDPRVFGVLAGRFEPAWLGIASLAGFVAALLALAVLYTIGSLQQSDLLRQLQAHVAGMGWLQEVWSRLAERELEQQQALYQSRQADFESRRQEALARYEQAHAARRDDIERRRTEELRAENSRYGEQQQGLHAAHAQQLAVLREEHAARSRAAAEAGEAERARHQAELDEYSQQRRRRQAEAWHRLKTTWFDQVRRLDAEVDAQQSANRERFLAWDRLAGDGWTPPAAIPPAVRLGDIAIDLHDWPGAVPDDMRLAPRSTVVRLPATLPFPACPSLLIKMAGAEGRAAAARALQSAMLRLLTLLPPGKLRFTIIDPVGLGESFAGFMHLADFDELLVTKRIWTEPGQIEERLADLTAHMENVLQKYLRNEFATIEEYNEFAGEVAEPYHILVVSDFPSKFSEIAARRLTSIVTSGPRCGVYTLMSCDTRGDLPHNFSLGTLEEHLPTLVWKKSALHAAAGPLARWPVQIDEPPAPETFTAIVRGVGEASKDARRVEVAFDRIAPPLDKVWTVSSRDGIDVPLGRAGATKLQHLRLGRGTSQHVLVAGKTGSGKSTFLHALITNVALHYSPDEVRFYLIDFKKGVEFKDYAALGLPHAEVIAIESDREFGVSALQRLDGVLKERGELFRRHGVQDVAGYRDLQSRRSGSRLTDAAAMEAQLVRREADLRDYLPPLPRILLVVDEFQEFFVEDDKLSQTAALLLDRLVRQGRAFGIHVVLGSQTLGGAYSLARSTLGQVAVRVALQCSEADAHLILSEENAAARLLTRPGEAIYNDANGLLEGNHPFQVAWLPDAQRETYLRQIADLAAARGGVWAPAIVFEGNVPSDARRNVELTRLYEDAAASVTRVQAMRDEGGGMRDGTSSAVGDPSSVHPHPSSPISHPSSLIPHPPTIWLGDAVEIKQPTAIVFHRQTGANVLLVGNDAEAALGTMATAIVAVAGVEGGGSRDETGELPRVLLLDGSPRESPQAEYWRAFAKVFADCVQVVGPRDASEVMARLAAEQAQRAADRDVLRPLVFVFVYNLSRFRDLRKAEDDFGMGGFGGGGTEKPVEPGRLFADLLAGGPECGLHTVIWCDSYNNVERWFSRQSLRELEYRVAFQMNAADSSNLIDSAAASKLGVHRALLYREETGMSEKFRPYGAPDLEWLRSLRAEALADVPADELAAPAADLDAFQVE